MITKETDIAGILNAGLGLKLAESIRIKETEKTYPIKTNIWDNWSPFAFRAFKIIQKKSEGESTEIRSFASIGTSNGADAIGAMHAFPELEKIVLTDFSKEALQVAEENVKKHLGNRILFTRYGSLTKPLDELKLDLIYENLPNIPDGKNINKGYKMASRYDKKILEHIEVPKEIDKHLLGVHYALLMGSKDFLTKNGSIICSIGGRVPYKLIKNMVESAGYKCKLLVMGFKVQTEPWEIDDGYAKAELGEIKFNFYRYNKVVKLLNLRKEKIIGEISPKVIEEKLMPYKISAKEAWEEYLKNNYSKFGHLVYIIRAMKK